LYGFGMTPRSSGAHRDAAQQRVAGVFGRIKRELTRLGRCYLKGRAGDAANVILSAVGYNLRLVLAWLRIILRVILLALLQTFTIRPALKPAS
jgi:IS5 family transposase